jgi:hypothetical protein
MTDEPFIGGECQGKYVKVFNVFFGDTLIEYNGKREWVGREMNVHWPVEAPVEGEKCPSIK